MCGIAVLIDKKQQQINENELTAMTDLVVHRGPDGKGVFIDGSMGIGHRRLSIIDLSTCANQPMFFGNLSIVFNGEIYNYIELREELTNAGLQFKSNSDTEVLLLAYYYWGEECVKKLRGMWAFCIYESESRTVFLSRDRFGIKPLYYTQTPSKFMAASEIKQFSAISDFEAKMNHAVVYEFLQHSVLNHNEFTFYENVLNLKPGHNLVYDLSTNKFKIYQWYFLEKIEPKSTHLENSARIFRKEFEEAVKLHLRSDVKLGCCLSGGLDSSSIVCMARKILGENAKIFTVTSCNENALYDETEYANAVVQECRTDSIFITPDLNTLYSENVLEKINWYQDQPIPSGSHFAEYNVFKAARENDLIVMLDGQGSDEYLAGYHNFFLFRCRDLLRRGKLRMMYTSIKERSLNRGIGVFTLYKEVLKLTLARGLKKLMVGRKPFYNFVKKEWADAQKNSPAVTYKGYNDIKNLRDLSLLLIKEQSIPYQLHSEDRNSMIFSIETRVPFLDHVLVESVFAMPEDNYFRKGVDKILIREGLREELPTKIYNRKTKLGFASSDDLWMREHSQEVRKRLQAAADYFKEIIEPSVLQAFDNYIIGKEQYNAIFFRILSLYAWAKATKVKS